LANDQSPHLSLAGAARARGRHRPRTAAPRADTPVHGRRVPAAPATVTAISAISPPRNGRTGIQSDPVQEPEWPRNRGRADEAVLQRRRRRRWDHDEDVCGCRGRSIHRMGVGMGGGLVLSSLLFPPPYLKTPSRDINILLHLSSLSDVPF
jgi:hypothetical protein